MIVDSGLMKLRLVQPLITEAHEIVAIMTSSRISAARNQSLKERGSRQLVRQIKSQKPKVKNLKLRCAKTS
jgi:hypothetical protein